MASDGLTCSICFECFDGQDHCPRVLRCGHSFCSDCLEKLIDCNAITCPMCEETCTFPMPAEVGDLPKNFALLDIMDTINATPQQAENVSSIGEEIEVLATKAMSYAEKIKAAEHGAFNVIFNMYNDHEKFSTDIQHLFMELHAVLTAREQFLVNELDEFYKNTVNECADEFAGLPSIFAFLSIKDASHHKCLVQAKAVSKSRNEKMEALALNDDEEYEAADAQVMGVILNLKEACEEVAGETHGIFIELHDELTARGQVLIDKLNRLYILKHSILLEQLQRLYTIQTRLESTIQPVRSPNIQSLSHADLLSVKCNMESMLEYIEGQYIMLEPEAEFVPEVIFDDLTMWSLDNLDGCELVCAVKNMGAVIDKSTCAETTTAATAAGFGLQCAPLGYEASFTIYTAYDAQRCRRREGGDVFVVELKGKTGEGKIEVNLENNGDGTYVATYTVPADAEPGDYMLSVLFRGTHIQDSPFVVRVGHPSAPNDVN